MKEHKNPAQTDRMWVFTSDPHLKEVLPHFLSPLELAILNAEFKLETYQIGDKVLSLDYHLNMCFRDSAKQRVKHFYSLLRRTRIEEAKKNDPAKRKFLNSYPMEHNLKRDLLYKLHHNNLTTMEKIGLMGRRELPHLRRMGKTSTAQLVTIFEMHDCGDLI